MKGNPAGAPESSPFVDARASSRSGGARQRPLAEHPELAAKKQLDLPLRKSAASRLLGRASQLRVGSLGPALLQRALAPHELSPVDSPPASSPARIL